jgi:hypothetical protein
MHRRWLVALFYSVVTAFCLAWSSFNPKQIAGAWIVCGCMILGTTFAIAFSGIAGDMHTRGDEREMHRREHAHFEAYSLFGKMVLVAMIAQPFFRGRNPITPLLPPALRGGMMDWPSALWMTACILYLTLPQAILLWSEPDMEESQ